jgi:NAD-dependent SIR2 family protein deacetylase
MASNVNRANCHACGGRFHIDELDAKDDGTGNYTILECRECYGPGFVPGPSLQAKPQEED